jgi:nitrogen regulatory protein P-II 1
MKLITAIVRSEKFDELIGTLIDNRAHGLTVSEVRGFGRQLGQLPGGLTDLVRPEDRKAMLLPKLRLDVVALDDDAEALVEAIAKHARTETIGDGKIWMTTVDSVLRVRTGDRDRAAV